MIKIYTSLAILTCSILVLTGCHSEKSSFQELKIDETNAHIRDLTKDFWASLDKWHNLSSDQGKIVNAWVKAMDKKYSSPKCNSGNKMIKFCNEQLRFYNKYGDVQREPDGTNYFDKLLTNYVKSHGDIDAFEYKPGHKQELLTRVNNFQEEIEKVSAGLSRGINTHWDTGIDPEWVPTVKKLRWFMASEYLELPHAGRDIVRIKELVQDCPG